MIGKNGALKNNSTVSKRDTQIKFVLSLLIHKSRHLSFALPHLIHKSPFSGCYCLKKGYTPTITTLYRHSMEEQTGWTHNPSRGSVIGILMTSPVILDWATTLTVSAMIKDSSKKAWRVRCSNDLATRLLTYKTGHKLKLEGVLGDLCQGAWDNAKRQIVPSRIKFLQ